MTETPEAQYKKAIKIAKKISTEMSWICANYETLKASGHSNVLEKFKKTSAEHTLKVVRRAILNEILIALARILIDFEEDRMSLRHLYRIIQNDEVMEIIKKNYKRKNNSFDDLKNKLLEETNKIEKLCKDDNSIVKSLLKHRHNYLAHNAIKPYTGDNALKWDDEKKLIDLLFNVIVPLEPLLIDEDGTSVAMTSKYKRWSEEFWSSFNPPK